MALAKALDCEPPAGWNDGCCCWAAGAGWKEDCVWTRASSLCLSENLCGAPWESRAPRVSFEEFFARGGDDLGEVP